MIRKSIRAFLTFALMAMMAFGAAAAPRQLSDYVISKCQELDSRATLPASPPRQSLAKYISAADLSGKFFIQWDDLGGNSPRQAYDAMTRITFTTDSAFIENFFGLDFTVRGKYDAATSTIQVKPQFAFTESPYGDFWICPFDVDRGGFYSDADTYFTLKIDENGHLKSTTYGWVIVITNKNSNYYGSALGMSRDLRFKLTNATMSGNQRNISAKTFSPVEYRVYVEQPAADDLMIANIATNGREVHMMLNSNKTWTMEPQVITENATAGAYCTFPATWTASSNKGTNANLTGEGDTNMIEFGPWGVFRATALTTCTFGMESSLLLLDDGLTISWPTASSNEFEGAGTQANPYKIASVADLNKLQRRVAAGENFSGKYFLQTAEINFADYAGMYYPIGSSSTICFDGTYDGGNKNIRNMNITRGSNQYTGLFGYCGANSHLTNINIVNGRLSTSGKYNGFIAGCCLGKIDNVNVNGALTSTTEYNGGIAGQSKSIRNSSFIGTLNGQAYTAGLSGYLQYDTVENCHVSAVITSSIPNTVGHSVGGLVGGLYGSATSGRGAILNSYFLGSLADNSGYAHLGGIAGTIGNYTSVERCVAIGTMTTSVTSSSIGSCGGIVGSLTDGLVTDCYVSMGIQAAKDNAKTGGMVGLTAKSATAGTPTLQKSLTTGQVRTNGIPAPSQAIAGSQGANVTFANLFADSQITGIDESKGGYPTAMLTAGVAPDGLDVSAWQFTSGRYPIPKNVVPANVYALASVPATLAGNEKINNVKSEITIALDPAVEWSLYENNQYKQESTGLKIEGNKVKLKGVLSQEFLCVRLTDEALGGTFSRIYYFNVAPAQFEGAGTAENPYLIKSVNDLKVLNTAITQNGLTFEGDYFAMANDIDFTGVTDFWGVADDSNTIHTFDATFDGRGHSIKNWKMQGLKQDATGAIVTKDSRQTSALFGIVGSHGVIKNLIIDASCSLEGAAGIASTVAINYGTVENVRNYASIKAGTSHAAGIVARMAEGAKMNNCYNAGSVTAGNTYAAGLISEMLAGSSVTNSQNDGAIRTDSLSPATKYANTSAASGLVGNTSGTGCVIINCVNQGSVRTSKEGAGIVARCSNGTTVENCVNTGILIVDTRAGVMGAIAGTNHNASEGFINNYYNGQVLYQGAVANDAMSGCNGLNTSALIAGQALQGLSTEVFDFQSGKYPVLKAFATETASKALRNMALIPADGDVVSEITANAAVTTGDNVQWTISGEGFALNGSVLNYVKLNKPGRAVLTASLNGWSREYNITGSHIPFQGAGTEADPYILASFADWQLLSQYTNDYGFRYEGRHFAMTGDVAFDSTVNYKPVAFNSPEYFMGIIDGRNHKLTGVHIEWTDKNSTIGYRYVGVIGNLGRGGALRNISVYGRVRAYTYVGALVGMSYGDIENCHNYAYVGTTNNTNTGGLIATAPAGSIIRCNNYGTVKGNYTVTGGVASYVGPNVPVSYCNNYGTVLGKDTIKETYYGTVGGIVGSCDGPIDHCYNFGTVAGSTSVGGVVGAFFSTIDSCANFADITMNPAATTIGGVAAKSGSGSVMTHCYNYGKIVGSNTTGGVLGGAGSSSIMRFCSNHALITGYSKAYTGGLLGNTSASLLVDSCANYADVVSAGTYTGGLVGGGVNNWQAINCVNYGNVVATGTSGYYTGGITGACSGTLEDCINHGSVTGASYGVGGISGHGTGNAYRCVNLGNVTSTYTTATSKYGNAGGIWGNAGKWIYDCINYGDVKGNQYVGGIMGYTAASTHIARVYFSGKLTSSDGNTTGAIVHKLSTHSKVIVDSAYYNTEMAGDFPTIDANAALATGMITAQLRTAALGDNFDYHDNALPTVRTLASHVDANVAATMINFKDGEHAGSFRTSARVELFPGAVWTVTPNLRLDGNKLCVIATEKLDPATVTVKGPNYTRTFNLVTDNGGNGVNALDADKDVKTVIYYTVAGVRVENPAPGTTVIEKRVYTDGTTSTRKVIIR